MRPSFFIMIKIFCEILYLFSFVFCFVFHTFYPILAREPKVTCVRQSPKWNIAWKSIATFISSACVPRMHAHFFFFILSKYNSKLFWTFGSPDAAKNHCKSASRFFSRAAKSFPRNICFVNALAFGEILANFNRNCSQRANASALSVAISSTRPTLCASSVVNIVPSVSALSAWRVGKTFFIDAWNHVGGRIPNLVSFKPIVKFGNITRYSQHNARRHPPAGEWPCWNEMESIRFSLQKKMYVQSKRFSYIDCSRGGKRWTI